MKVQDLVRQLQDQVPLSPTEKLEKALKKAITEEDYERAAKIRDRLRHLGR